MRLVSLASGSSGNCILVDDGDTRLLVDCGIGPRTLKQRLATAGAADPALDLDRDRAAADAADLAMAAQHVADQHGQVEGHRRHGHGRHAPARALRGGDAADDPGHGLRVGGENRRDSRQTLALRIDAAKRGAITARYHPRP